MFFDGETCKRIIGVMLCGYMLCAFVAATRWTIPQEGWEVVAQLTNLAIIGPLAAISLLWAFRKPKQPTNRHE